MHSPALELDTCMKFTADLLAERQHPQLHHTFTNATSPPIMLVATLAAVAQLSGFHLLLSHRAAVHLKPCQQKARRDPFDARAEEAEAPYYR